MLLNRQDYNKAIAAVQAANDAHKQHRALYMKEIRELGTTLRAKLCRMGGLASYINTVFLGNPSNPNAYGVEVFFDAVHDNATDDLISAIRNHMEDHGWQNVATVTRHGSTHRIVAY